jgi:aspartate/methionine/tyrosine aminotransferase
MNESIRPHESSVYMHWAKLRQAARFNLAVSGVPAVTLRDLPIRLEDLEISGPSYYGWPPLLEGLSRLLGVGADRIVHAAGTSMANHLAMAVCLERGDEVLIEEPTYELLVDAARYLGAVIRRFPRRREDGFLPDLQALRAAITTKTRLIVLTNLHNPTSALIEDSMMREIAGLAAEAGARLLVDEVYLDALFDRPQRTAALLGHHVLTTSSLTKVYGMSGLRCGWVVASPGLAERLWRLNDLFGVIPAHAAERMSVIAVDHLPVLRERARRTLDANRARWNAFLAGRAADLDSVPVPFGTVTFPRLISGRVEPLAELLRARYETTVAPGHFFGVPDAFRVGFGTTEEVFVEGLKRLGQALDERP